MGDKDKISEQTMIDFYFALERYLNAYDMACQLYLDGKVDKVRFQKSYAQEIKKNIQDFQDKYGEGSEYYATKEVNRKFNNPEIRR